MTQTMLEYVLNSMYIAIISAGLNDHQRAPSPMTRCFAAPICRVRQPALRKFCGASPATRSIKKQSSTRRRVSPALKSLPAALLD